MQIATNKGMKSKDLGFDLSNRRTRKKVLFGEMEQVMFWNELLILILPLPLWPAQVACRLIWQ